MIFNREDGDNIFLRNIGKLLPSSSALKVEAISSSETFITLYHVVRRHAPEASNPIGNGKVVPVLN
jgi:hypothetical protein